MSGPTARALPPGRVMADTSFLIALLEGDPAAQTHAGVLARAVVDAITLGQVCAALDRSAGIGPATIEEALRALGVSLVDHPVAAAAHVPAVAAAESARCAHQHADGSEKATALPVADLAVLAHAIAAGLAVLTGNQHWTNLAYGLGIEICQCP